MPENPPAGQATPDWTKESVEQQAAQVEEKPAPEVEAQTETESEPEVQEKVKVQKVVSYNALHEERAKRKEANLRAQQLEQQVQFLSRQQQELMARLGQPQAAQPDPTDPIGVMQHGIQKTQGEVQQLRENQDRQNQAAQQQQQLQSFVQHVQSQDAEFKARQPDSHEAIDYLRKGMLEEIKAQGATHQQAVAAVKQEELRMAWVATQQGENPSEMAYNRAQARGYVPSQKKLEMQKQGQGASMPSASGGRSGGQPSLEALLKMSSADFTKATAGDNWAKLVGK